MEALGYNSATLKALSAASPTPRSYQPSRPPALADSTVNNNVELGWDIDYGTLTLLTVSINQAQNASQLLAAFFPAM